MLDATGREMYEDDFVVISTSSGVGLTIGRILAFTRSKIKVRVLGKSYSTNTRTNEVRTADATGNNIFMAYPHQVSYFDAQGTHWEESLEKDS